MSNDPPSVSRHRSRMNSGPVGNTAIDPDQAHAAALRVAARYRNDPATAREVLDMLGLLGDTGRTRHRLRLR